MTKENRAFSAGSRRKSVSLARAAMFAILALSLGSAALAQAPPAGTNGPQPFFFPAPPAGFDPVQAADADLATYGFPKRPPLADQSYASWAKVVANAKYRVANPVAQNTGIFHAPPHRAPLPAGGSGDNGNSSNWSGVDEVYSYPFFATQNNGFNSVVVGAWPQPSIGSENCTYGPYKMWTWVGMDGSPDAIAGKNDVLQAGFAAEACPTQNYAWYEWYTEGCTVNTAAQPCSAWMVQNFPVNTGDYLYVTVTYTTSSPNGTAFLQDQTTGQYISIGYNQPSGPPSSMYQGYSAEWIVERPTSSNGTLYNLANYGSSYMQSPAYLHTQSYITPGYDTSGAFNVISMYCAAGTWNPSYACDGAPYLSEASYWSYYQQPPSGYYTELLYFLVAGPAASQ